MSLIPTNFSSKWKQRLGYAFFNFQMNWARYVILALVMVIMLGLGYEWGSNSD